MSLARDIYGTVFKNGTATLLARILGNDGRPIAAADVSAIRYAVFLLDDGDANRRIAVAGHQGADLPVPAVVANALQTDPPWTLDAVGYNFRHLIDVSTAPAFAVAGRRYLVEYRLTPHAGQALIVRFRLNVI